MSNNRKSDGRNRQIMGNCCWAVSRLLTLRRNVVQTQLSRTSNDLILQRADAVSRGIGGKTKSSIIQDWNPHWRRTQVYLASTWLLGRYTRTSTNTSTQETHEFITKISHNHITNLFQMRQKTAPSVGRHQGLNDVSWQKNITRKEQ